MFRLHVNAIAFLKNIEKQMNLPDTKLHLLLNSLSDRIFLLMLLIYREMTEKI